MVAFDVQALRQEFPILQRQIDGHPLVYLDNAATTQKPQCVIDALVNYYSHSNSNVHRGAHRLADEATRAYEAARDTIAAFIGAGAREEVIWTSGTTESINIVSHGLAQILRAGDEVVVTELEHHANLVTWQQACAHSGASLKIAPINAVGELDIAAFESVLSRHTKFVAFPHASNALGTLNPVKLLCQKAKAVGAMVLVDGAQGIAHEPVNVQDLGCDFYAFSAHKIYGPMGMGVLWGKEALLRDWPVWQTGGEMIAAVSYQSAQWNVLPYRFEAGTPNVGGAIAFGRAIQWFQQLPLDAVHQHEQTLLTHCTEQLLDIEGLTLHGSASAKVSVVSFTMAQGHPADVGFLLDRQGIAIRTGHHCAEPLMSRLNVPGTARASFAVYNTEAEVVALAEGLKKAAMMLA